MEKKPQPDAPDRAAQLASHVKSQWIKSFIIKKSYAAICKTYAQP